MPQIVVAPGLVNMLDEDRRPYAVPLAGTGTLGAVFRGALDGQFLVVSGAQDRVLQQDPQCGLVVVRGGRLFHKMAGQEEVCLGDVHGSLIGVRFGAEVQFLTLTAAAAVPVLAARKAHQKVH